MWFLKMKGESGMASIAKNSNAQNTVIQKT